MGGGKSKGQNLREKTGIIAGENSRFRHEATDRHGA